MLSSPASDLARELGRRSRPEPAPRPWPAQLELPRARQAELVICDCAIERSFAWISRYRRLNTIFERTKEHLIAFVEIAFISILSRRLARLETKCQAA
jgi:hypothetical protein